MYEYPVSSTAPTIANTQTSTQTPTPPPVYSGALPPTPLPRARRGVHLSAFIAIAVVLIIALVILSPLSLVRAQAIAYPHPNVAIVYSTGSSRTALTGKPVQFHVRVSAGHKMTYAWDFGDGASATGAQVAHSFHDFGQYQVALTATDPVGQSTHTRTFVHVLPGPPTADFSFSASPNDPFHITFDGRASTGLRIQYHWAFGDGSSNTTTSPQTSHEYSSNTTYTAILTVRDPANQTASISHPVTIVIPQPHASFTSSTSSNDPFHVNFDASGSTGYKLHYQWAFGDGQSDQSGAQVSHEYGGVGTFTVSLTVTDQIGQISRTTRLVTISIPPPQAAFQVYGTSDPATFNFDGSFSSGYQLSYSWDFNDGGSANGQQASHTYTNNGTYDVTLTVTDKIGRNSSWSQWVSVTGLTVPNAPSNISATALDANNILVQWNDNSDNENGFAITDDGGSTWQYVGANTTSYTWGGFAAGSYVCFYVVAYNAAGYSAATPFACTTTPNYAGNTAAWPGGLGYDVFENYTTSYRHDASLPLSIRRSVY